MSDPPPSIGYNDQLVMSVYISHSATVIQTLMASDNSVLNVDGTRYNPAVSYQ